MPREKCQPHKKLANHLARVQGHEHYTRQMWWHFTTKAGPEIVYAWCTEQVCMWMAHRMQTSCRNHVSLGNAFKYSFRLVINCLCPIGLVCYNGVGPPELIVSQLGIADASNALYQSNDIGPARQAGTAYLCRRLRWSFASQTSDHIPWTWHMHKCHILAQEMTVSWGHLDRLNMAHAQKSYIKAMTLISLMRFPWYECAGPCMAHIC